MMKFINEILKTVFPGYLFPPPAQRPKTTKPPIVLEEYNGEFKYYVIDLNNAITVNQDIQIVQIFLTSDDYTAKSNFTEWIKNHEYFPKHKSQYLLLRSL